MRWIPYVVSLLAAFPARAGEEAPPAGATWIPYGEARAIFGTTSDFPVDAEGHELGQHWAIETRARLGLRVIRSGLVATVEGDVLNGMLAGDPWDVPGTIDERHRDWPTALSWDGVRMRAFQVAWRGNPVSAQVGLGTSHWGLGMVANDGAHDPWFGKTEFGDRVIRSAASFRTCQDCSVPLVISAAFDVVVADEVGRLRDGAVPLQWILSGIWEDAAHRRIGVYGVHRRQLELTNDRFLSASVIDGYVDIPIALPGEWKLRVAGEAAGIIGVTDRAPSWASLQDDRFRLGVASFGATGLVEATDPSGHLDLRLRGGYASADGDPDDGASHDFSFDRDFAVGMVLFDEVQGAVEAAAYAQLTDPEYAGDPPDGIDATVTEGAFRRAVFVEPGVSGHLFDQLTGRAAVVLATSTGPIAQSFYTYRAGGQPTSHHNLPSQGRWIGTEIDWALAWAKAFEVGSGAVRPGVEVQGGHAILGPTLKGDGPGVVHRVQAIARLGW